MNIDIAGYTFEGPFNMLYESERILKDESGVYVILGYKDGRRYYVDVGESGEVKTRVANHDREACWENQGYSDLRVAVLYDDEMPRRLTELLIRLTLNPPCGVE